MDHINVFVSIEGGSVISPSQEGLDSITEGIRVDLEWILEIHHRIWNIMLKMCPGMRPSVYWQ